MESHPVGVELFHADRQTDMANPTVVFLNFAKAPLTAPYTTMNTAGCNGISAVSGRSVFTMLFKGGFTYFLPVPIDG